MSVTIRANSRLSTNLDNNSAADATTMAQNGERNLITAADRAEREAELGELAHQLAREVARELARAELAAADAAIGETRHDSRG